MGLPTTCFDKQIAHPEICKMGDRFFRVLSVNMTENILTESEKSDSQNPKSKLKLWTCMPMRLFSEVHNSSTV